MRAPPPVQDLLSQLRIMAANVQAVPSESLVDWNWRPALDQWSLTEVMCHLRDVEREVHLVRFKVLLADENAFLPGVSADEWAVERKYRQQDGPAARSEFLLARAETLMLLERTDAELWERQGRHAFFGPTSMHELLYLVARHDDGHWTQIQELLAAQRSDSGAESGSADVTRAHTGTE